MGREIAIVLIRFILVIGMRAEEEPVGRCVWMVIQLVNRIWRSSLPMVLQCRRADGSPQDHLLQLQSLRLGLARPEPDMYVRDGLELEAFLNQEQVRL